MEIFINNKQIYLYFVFILINFFFYIKYEKIGYFLKLQDIPDSFRKKHKSKVFQLGGVIIFYNVLLFVLLNYLFDLGLFNIEKNSLFSFLFGSSLIFFIGLYDDSNSLRPFVKIFLITIVLFICISLDDSLNVNSLSFETFQYKISVEKINVFFSILCFLLFLNSINMFDGINLQSGIYSLIFISFLLIKENVFFELLVVLLFSMVFFLYLNYKNKIFLGDSGTLLLAFILGFIIIKSYNYEDIKFVEEIFILMAIPGIDMFRLFIYRIIKNKSPFSADRSHIHHYISNKLSYIFTNMILQGSFLISLILMSFIMKVYIIFFLLIFYFIMLYKFKY